MSRRCWWLTRKLAKITSQFRIFLESIGSKRLSGVLGSFSHSKVCQEFPRHRPQLETLSREPSSKNYVRELRMVIQYMDLIG